MTYEELRAEAKAQGYKLMPIKQVEKLLPCTCGSKRREHWQKWIGNDWEITLCCMRCGKSVSGIGDAGARSAWNEMIRSESE